MRRRKRQKANSQRIHALRRLDERFEVSQSMVAMATMTSAIRYQSRKEYRNKVFFVDRQSNRVSRFLVQFEGKWYPVVYDKMRKVIVTVLPDGALGPDPQAEKPERPLP